MVVNKFYADKEKFFSWKGRLRRRDYFIRSMAASFALYFLVKILSEKEYGAVEILKFSFLQDFQLSLMMVALILGLFMLFQYLKRIHDTGKSAWWLLLTLIPIIGNLLYFYLMFKDSDQEENIYGPNPKNIFVEEEV